MQKESEMEYIMIGILGIVAFISLYGVYKILTGIKFSIEEERYTYVVEKDEYGNTYEKVVDNTDNENREWEWKV